MKMTRSEIMSNSKDKVLYSSRWNEVRLKDDWYEYTHAPWMRGIGVAVLAYRKGENGYEYLGRYETTPCHSPAPKLCSITGGYDNYDKFSIVDCALNELKEEGGYIAPLEAVIPLGTVYPSKGSDTVQHLFAVDIDHSGVTKTDPTGDGTRGEHGSFAKWESRLQILFCGDPLNATMLARLEQILSSGRENDMRKFIDQYQLAFFQEKQE